MHIIKEIRAHRSGEENSQCWRGRFRIDFIPGSVRGIHGSLIGKHFKNILKEKYPESKKNFRVQKSIKNRNTFLFQTKFLDCAEEAEFIMTIKNFEGEIL